MCHDACLAVRTTCGSWFSFYHMDVEDRIQVVWLCCKYLNPFSHLTCPENTFIIQEFVLTWESPVFVFRLNLAVIFEEC